MIDFVLTYPGFTLFGVVATCLLLKGTSVSVRHRSWLPLLVYAGTIVGMALLGVVAGLLYLSLSH